MLIISFKRIFKQGTVKFTFLNNSDFKIDYRTRGAENYTYSKIIIRSVLNINLLYINSLNKFK